MKLRELTEWLYQQDPYLVVEDGFGSPHCDRGNYNKVAFTPAPKATIKAMAKHAQFAYGTFGGWKGGEYTFNDDTECRIGHWGEIGEDITEEHLEKWLSKKSEDSMGKKHKDEKKELFPEGTITIMKQQEPKTELEVIAEFIISRMGKDAQERIVRDAIVEMCREASIRVIRRKAKEIVDQEVRIAIENALKDGWRDETGWMRNLEERMDFAIRRELSDAVKAKIKNIDFTVKVVGEPNTHEWTNGPMGKLQVKEGCPFPDSV